MAEFVYNGIRYEELPDGKARVIGPAAPGASLGGRPVYQELPPEPAPVRPVQEQRDRVGLQRDIRDLNKPDFIPGGATHMLGPDGRVVPIPGVSSLDKQRDTAESLLRAAGVDIQRGIDPVSDLIRGSTSGPIQRIGAQAYGAVTGDATDGMENIARLQTIVSDLTTQLTGGTLGSQISNSDREFIVQRVGNLADANVPADARLAAWDQVKRRMANILGVQPAQGGQGGGQSEFSDQERAAILAYLPFAKSPDELRQFAQRVRPGMTIGNAEEVLQYVQGGGDPSRLSWTQGGQVQMAVGNEAPQESGPDLGRALGVGTRAVVQGAGDIANLVSSPFVHGVNAIAGTNYNPDMGDNLADMLNLPEPQSDAENLAYQVGRFGTSALGAAGLARAAAPYIAGVAGQALQRFGNAPLTDSAAGAAGGASAETARQMGAPPAVQIAAGVAGGAASLPVSGRVNALTQGPRPVPSVVRAGQQEGVTVNRAMVDPATDPKTTVVGKTYVGSRMMRGKMAGIGDEIEGRVQALGQGGNRFQEPAALGGAVQSIGRRYIQASGAEFKKHYGQLRQQAADVPIAANEAIGHIDSVLARLKKAPSQNFDEIEYLEGLKDDISNGIDVETARDIGSRLSKDIAKGDVTFGPYEAAVLDIRKALARDTENGLAAAGRPDLATAYREVDAAYSKRMAFIQQKLQRLLGKRNNPLDPEKAAGKLGTMAGVSGDATGIRQILAKATPEERADIAATFAHSLGRDKDGAFSTAKFVRDLSAMPLSARVAIFGREGARSLDNLRAIATEHKRVTARLGGSPTALATDWRGYLYNFVLGSVPGFMTGNVGTSAALAAGGVAVKAGRDAMSARMLMSPKVTAWLRSAPKTNDPKAINAHFDRLRAIAVREPALAPEIQRFEEALMRAANENVTPGIAASESD